MAISAGLGSIIGGLGGAGISSAFGLYAQNQAEKNQGHYLQKQQDFNAQQANIHRGWSADEAHKARQFSKNAYKRQVQWRVADMKKAGINPILAVSPGSIGSMPSSASASGGSPASSSLQSDNSVNSGLTAMQSYSSMFESVTRSIANVLKATKDEQNINIKTPIEDVAGDLTGSLKGMMDRGGKIADKLGIPKKVQNAVARVVSPNSAKSYEASYSRLNTVYKSMQRLKGLPKSSYTNSNYQKIANTILRDRTLKDGQKGILLHRLRNIWRSGK